MGRADDTRALLTTAEREAARRDALALLETEDSGAVKEIEAAGSEMISAADVRVKQLAGDLATIEELAATLARTIERYQENLTDALGSKAGWMENYDLWPAPLDPDALMDLSRTAGAACGALVQKFGSGDPDEPDRGGPALSTRELGKPKRRFVDDLAAIWSSYRPDALSAHVDGLFGRFVLHCWQWTTGDFGPPPGLADDIQAVLPRWRRRIMLIRRADEHDALARNLERLGLPAEAHRRRRHADLIRRQLALARRG